MNEIDQGMVLYEQIIENLDDSYWNKNLNEIQRTNRGYVKIDGKWFTFGWFVGWGIVLSTIKKMDHIPDISKAFNMRDYKSNNYERK